MVAKFRQATCPKRKPNDLQPQSSIFLLQCAPKESADGVSTRCISALARATALSRGFPVHGRHRGRKAALESKRRPTRQWRRGNWVLEQKQGSERVHWSNCFTRFETPPHDSRSALRGSLLAPLSIAHAARHELQHRHTQQWATAQPDPGAGAVSAPSGSRATSATRGRRTPPRLPPAAVFALEVPESLASEKEPENCI